MKEREIKIVCVTLILVFCTCCILTGIFNLVWLDAVNKRKKYAVKQHPLIFEWQKNVYIGLAEDPLPDPCHFN